MEVVKPSEIYFEEYLKACRGSEFGFFYDLEDE